MSEATPASPQRSNHIQSPNCKGPDKWNGLPGYRGLVRHVGVELTAFTLVDYVFCHFICSRPIESRSVCFGHNGPRGRMVTTGPRVDVVENHSTFFWRDAPLINSSNTLSVKLSTYYREGFGSTDNLTCLIFIFWKLFPKNISNIRYCLIRNDDQNLHDQVDHGWNLDLSRIGRTFWLWGLFCERILLN